MIPIDRARSLGAVVIGRAGMDLYPEPDGTKIVEATGFVCDVGGSAGNIAVALARQDVATALVGPLSDDAVGRFVRDKLTHHRVDTSRCRSVGSGARTSLAFAETRAEDCEVVIYRNGAADFELAESDLDPALIASASVLIITGTALAAEPSRSAVMAALAASRTAATFAILDVDHRPYSWPSDAAAARTYREAARQCDAIIGNEDEFGLIAGEGNSALATAKRFIDDGGQFAILKKGGDGSVAVTPTGIIETGVFRVSVKKPFGAGDAFIGGLVAALLRGDALEAAIARASGSAALVVSRRGCASAMPSTAELDSFVASNPAVARTRHAHSTL
jgi:5-dehydro-2-deoxygluconokinase